MNATQLFALVAFTVACGDTGHTYPTETVDNFMAACQARGTSERACDCALDNIRERYSVEDYNALEARVAQNDPKATAEMAELAADCQGK
jgi:hypothetical protein